MSIWNKMNLAEWNWKELSPLFPQTQIEHYSWRIFCKRWKTDGNHRIKSRLYDCSLFFSTALSIIRIIINIVTFYNVMISAENPDVSIWSCYFPCQLCVWDMTWWAHMPTHILPPFWAHICLQNYFFYVFNHTIEKLCQWIVLVKVDFLR